MKLLATRASLAALCLYLFSLAATTSLAQEVSGSDVVRINTDLVVLDAQVIDKRTAQTVSGLRREDFELYEDGARQEISYFSQDELPLSILLLLDTSGSVRPIIEQIGAGAQSAFEQLKPQDEVAVMAFATYPKLIQEFTRDRRLITEKIKEASRTDVGRATFLNIALDEAAFEMSNSSNPSSRRVIIVITDNIGKRGSRQEVDRTMRELYESGTVVNGLVVRAAVGKVLNVMTLGLVKAVNTYSEQTGGEILNADRSEVEAKLAETLRHLRMRYSLGFRPTNTEREGFRRLKVQLLPATAKRIGKAVVRTKPGYYFRRKSTE